MLPPVESTGAGCADRVGVVTGVDGTRVAWSVAGVSRRVAVFAGVAAGALANGRFTAVEGFTVVTVEATG
jgi:hypothetical protein